MDSHAIKNILNFLSRVGLAFSGFLLIPLFAGICFDEPYTPFLYFVTVFFLFHLLLFWLLRRHEAALTLKEGILSVNFVWILLGIGGAIPMLLYTQATPAQAFFESISGFTTTGATIFGSLESLPKMILMLRSVMHWIGGMGIIILSIGLFSLISPSGTLTLFKAEATGIRMEKLTPKIRDTALRLWGIYMFLTLLDMLLLYTEGMPLFDALNHAMSTISTGGFSTKDASLGFYADNSAILWTTTLFMLLSGINFLAHLRFLSRGSSVYDSDETRWYLLIFLLLSVALGLYLYLHDAPSLYYAMTHAFFTIASVLTTTGFVSTDYEVWGQGAIVFIIIAMMIGGSAGSTAGGVKVVRWIIVVRSVIREVKHVFHPDALLPLLVDREIIQNRVLLSTFAVVTLFVLTAIFTTLYLYAGGYDILTSLSTAFACVGNIGPGFGMTGPSHYYGFFETSDLMVLSTVMIAGRLEFFTLLLLLSKSFWKKF